MFAPTNALVSTISSPLTAAKVCSLRRSCRAKEKIRKHAPSNVPVSGTLRVFAKNNNNATFYASDNASDTKAADDLYDWAREDQLRALEDHRHRREASGDIDRRFLHAHDSDEDGSKSWSERDQVVELRNNALNRYMHRAAEDCSVSWMDTDVADHGECVQDVSEVMALLKHADASETQDIVDTLIEAGGSKAAEAIAAWCDINPEHMSHAAAVREAMGHHEEEEHRRRKEEEKRRNDDDDDEDGELPVGSHFAGLYNSGFTDYGGLVAPLPLGVPIGTFFPPPPSDAKME